MIHLKYLRNNHRLQKTFAKLKLSKLLRSKKEFILKYFRNVSYCKGNASTSLEFTATLHLRAPVNVHDRIVDDVTLALGNAMHVVGVHVVSHDKQTSSFEQHRPQAPVAHVRHLKHYMYK